MENDPSRLLSRVRRRLAWTLDRLHAQLRALTARHWRGRERAVLVGASALLLIVLCGLLVAQSSQPDSPRPVAHVRATATATSTAT
ncbi:MAG TPA: hypothetical protein VF916_15545, partial [Ktedonobacterales bacterium]